MFVLRVREQWNILRISIAMHVNSVKALNTPPAGTDLMMKAGAIAVIAIRGAAMVM
jgi:hypothetical protein